MYSRIILAIVLGLAVASSSAFGQTPRLFRANGEHKCQSSTDIGHTCMNFGTNYTSCDEAYFKLKREDCCPATQKRVDGKLRFGGTSIDFHVNSCTIF